MKTVNRRGISGILGDLSWILTFTICAYLLYAFLYQPLLAEKYDHGIQTTRLSTDAQYIALTLPRLQASSSSTTLSPDPFSTAIAEVVTARKRTSSDSDFKKFVDGSAYAATLDSTFGANGAFWTPDPEARHRVRMAVMLTVDGKDLPETCRDYGAPSSTTIYQICDTVTKDLKWKFVQYLGFELKIVNAIVDPSSVASAFTSKPSTTALPDHETGAVYIPTTDTPTTLNVYIQWPSTT